MNILKVIIHTHVSVEGEKYILRETTTMAGTTGQWFEIKNGKPRAMGKERAAALQSAYERLANEDPEPPSDIVVPDFGAN